jgi:disulfide bond formation protein DsbB
MMIPRLRWALLITAASSGAALLFALSTEWYGGLVPCALCLVERWPYRVVMELAVIGLLLPRRWAWAVLAICTAIIAGGAAVAFIHVGVEHLWWPSPLPECTAPRMPPGISIAERMARLPATVSKPCDEPTYLIPVLPVSMAAMNLVFALALTAVLLIFMVRSNRSAR